MNRICIILSCLCLIISGGTAMSAQERTLPVSGIVMDFEPVCDTLDSLAYARLTVKVDLELEAVMRRGNSLDFYFSRSLGDLPWTSKDVKWFRSELKSRFPEGYRNRNLGSIFSRGTNTSKRFDSDHIILYLKFVLLNTIYLLGNAYRSP